jgi:hypothetical protein
MRGRSGGDMTMGLVIAGGGTAMMREGIQYKITFLH